MALADGKAAGQKENISKRRPEPELLRCVAMCMVIVLHFLGKGGLLGELSEPDMQPVRAAAWVLEAFAICAVNLYMLLSGYFLSASRFKLSRLLQLLLQIWTFSVGVGLGAVALGLVPGEEVNTYFLLRLFFPVLEEHYWFLTAYIFLYLLLPLIGGAVREMDRKSFRLTLFLFLTAFCLIKTAMPVQFDTDRRGYDCLWYLCVFLTAAYIRRFGLPLLEKRGRGILLYLGSVLLILAVTFGLRTLYFRTGSLERVLGNCFHYNHLLPYLAALGLFLAFLRVKIPEGFWGRLTVWAGPRTLGVYLLHENLAVRDLWPVWFGVQKITNVIGLAGSLLTAVIVVFTVGILTEWLRDTVMKGLHRGLTHLKIYRTVTDKIAEADSYFGRKAE